MPSNIEQKPLHLGLKIKLLRIESRLTITELAKKTGVAKSSLSRIERDAQCVRLDNFVAICSVLKAHPIELLCGSQTWTPEKVSL